MIAECFRAWLASDMTPRIDGLTCWQRVGNYPNGGDNKAAFCFDPPPPQAEVTLAVPRSFIVTITEGAGSPGPLDARGHRGLEQHVTVRVYAARSFSHKDLCDMAYAVAESFWHAEIRVPGWANGGCWSNPPQDEEERPGVLPAYRLECRILLSQLAATTTGAP